jgi:hypothetical protein
MGNDQDHRDLHHALRSREPDVHAVEPDDPLAVRRRTVKLKPDGRLLGSSQHTPTTDNTKHSDTIARTYIGLSG